MVSVDNICATTSTWKPGAQFLLTINNMQPNPDYNNIMDTIYNDLTAHACFIDTVKCVHM